MFKRTSNGWIFETSAINTSSSIHCSSLIESTFADGILTTRGFLKSRFSGIGLYMTYAYIEVNKFILLYLDNICFRQKPINMDIKNQHIITSNLETNVCLHTNERKDITTPAQKIFHSSRNKFAEITGLKCKPKVKFKPVRNLNEDLFPITAQENDSDKENSKKIGEIQEKKLENSKVLVFGVHDSNIDFQEEIEKNGVNTDIKSIVTHLSDAEISENHSLPTGVMWLDTPKTKSINEGVYPMSVVKNYPKPIINTVCKNESTNSFQHTGAVYSTTKNVFNKKENSTSSGFNSYLKPTPKKSSILDNIFEDSVLSPIKIPNDSLLIRKQFLNHNKLSHSQSETKQHTKSYTTPSKKHDSFKSIDKNQPHTINYENNQSVMNTVNNPVVNIEHINMGEKLLSQNIINKGTKSNIHRPLFNDNVDLKIKQNIEGDLNKLSLNNININTNSIVPMEQKNNIAKISSTNSSLKPLVANIQVQIPKRNVQNYLCNDPLLNDTEDNNYKNDEIINVISSFPLPTECYRKYQSIIIKDQEYSILNKVGDGGSCEVYQIFDFKRTQLKALKVVNLAVDRITAQGYINEVKLLSKLQGSDCVIKMYDYEIFQEQKRLFVVLERGDIDLAKLLRNTAASRSQLPLPIIVFYWTEMLTAVKYIHDNGIIHSDLKPGNFLVVMGRLKLIDFGIASMLDDNMTSIIKSTQTGTFNYISPEALIDSQANSPDSPLRNTPKIKISYKSDVWSLGCILYNLVYRRTPFQHITKSWMKMEAIKDPSFQISYPEAPHCSEVVMDAMKKCLTYEISKRPTVNELLCIKYI